MRIVFLCFWKKGNLSTPCRRDGGAPKGLLEIVAVLSDNMKKENNLSKCSGMDKETV